MARIRTIKPEAFTSETLAEVSLTAERTFFGLLTQADDHGRFRDNAAVIAGLLWPLRPEHTPMDVGEDLAQLETAGLICRYVGEDEKAYLHIISWHRHQKINRPSGSRLPACPHHDPARDRTEASARTPGALGESSVSTHRGLSEDTAHTQGTGSNPAQSARHTNKTAGHSPTLAEESTSHGGLSEDSVSPHRPDLGSRNRDLGSPPVGGASAPAPNTVSAKQLVAEYAAACAHRPPGDVLGQLGRQAAKLLDEGIAPDHIRVGLERLQRKGLHASVLPSLVNEAMNAPQPAAAHRAWTNPADAEAAYGGEL